MPGISGPRRYRACATCDLYFLNPECRLDADAERRRYDLHDGDLADAGYAGFVRPLIEAIGATVPRDARGLDFGAGRTPVLAHLLRTRGYDVAVHDAFYWPATEVFEQKFDFVVACEVIEHLYDPARELSRLRGVLNPGGTLFVMTDPRRDEVDFDLWYYRRDPTHVAFYSARTFRFIAPAFGFKNVDVAHRVVTFHTTESPHERRPHRNLARHRP